MTWILNLFRRILHWLRTFHCAECDVRKPKNEKELWGDKQGIHDVCQSCYSYLWHERNDKELEAEFKHEVFKQRRLLQARRQARNELRAEQAIRDAQKETNHDD